MHVAVVTTSYPTSLEDPAGHFVAADVRVLQEAGHRVTVLAPWPGTASSAPRSPAASRTEAVIWLAAGDLFGAPGALERVRSSPLRLRHLPLFALRVNNELRRLSYQKLIAHWLLPTAFPVCFVGLPRKHPGPKLDEVVVHGTDARLLERLPKALSRRLLTRWVSGGVRFRCVSEEIRSLLCELHPNVRGQSFVAPSAMTIPALPSKTELREQLSLGAHDQVLVCVGRLIRDKRIDVALAVATRAKPERARSKRILVLGDGPLLAELKQRFPNAEFLGQRPRQEALAYLKAADVLISASRLEGAPTAIREARAVGTEVWCCPAGDVLAWAEHDSGIHLLGELDEGVLELATTC